MTKLNIHRHDWVVVCDGRKALILENLGDEKSPNLRMKEEREHPESAHASAGNGTAGPPAALGRNGAQRGRADRLA